jgi:hypothetical protein
MTEIFVAIVVRVIAAAHQLTLRWFDCKKMGANKSRPLKESARTVLARRNAMPEVVETAQASKATPIRQTAAIPTQSYTVTDKMAANPQNGTLMTARSGFNQDQGHEPMQKDILNQISKWTVETKSQVL